MPGELKDRVAVITGATRGLGRATARAFGEAGARLVLVGRSTAERRNKALPGTLEEAAAEVSETGAEVLAVPADLSREEDVARVVEQTSERFGQCDILVNNAAVSFLGPFLDVRPSKWRAVIGVNLLAPVALTHAFLPGMVERGDGRVINVSSGAALNDGENVLQLPYSVTKLGLERLTTGLAHQFIKAAVAINCVRIDEVIPTEAVTLHAPELAERARHTPVDFGGAMRWLAAQPVGFTGKILTLAQLRDAGALPAG